MLTRIQHFHRRCACLLILAFLVMTGMHRPLLQAAAWTGMLLTRARVMPLREAVVSTFSGEQPCSLCRALRAEQAPPAHTVSAPVPDDKIQMAPHRPRPLMMTVVTDAFRCDVAAADSLTPDAPPVPPPRSYLVV